MKVSVEFFATLGRFRPGGEGTGWAVIEVPEGSTLGALARMLEIPPDLSRVVLVNGQDAGPDQPLRAGDVVALFPPLVGGV